MFHNIRGKGHADEVYAFISLVTMDTLPV